MNDLSSRARAGCLEIQHTPHHITHHTINSYPHEWLVVHVHPTTLLRHPQWPSVQCIAAQHRGEEAERKGGGIVVQPVLTLIGLLLLLRGAYC